MMSIHLRLPSQLIEWEGLKDSHVYKQIAQSNKPLRKSLKRPRYK